MTFLQVFSYFHLVMKAQIFLPMGVTHAATEDVRDKVDSKADEIISVLVLCFLDAVRDVVFFCLLLN